MLDLLLKLTRGGVLVFWVAALLSLFGVIPEPFGKFIAWLAVIVLLIHLSEYFYVRRRFAKSAGLKISFILTLLFGLTHWLPLVVGPGEDE